MAFSYTVLHRGVFGSKKVVYGTWSATSVTGGDIVTGLTQCDVLIPVHTGSAVEANVSVANETFPVAGGTVTLVCSSDDAGLFLAIGK